MELVNQHTKKIMEGCKERARAAGLCFQDETLEYIVTNRDLLELTPKMMIPTLYDFWVHDVEVLKEKGKYELYPANPYETAINTRPPISFYNDNNPDWLNVLIFYHVLAHIDFFQNNQFFRHTWDYDFAGQALSDKRLIAQTRSEKGRWVDYIIEFTRSMDNLAGYYLEVGQTDEQKRNGFSKRLNFYFDVFLQSVKEVKVSDYIKEIERYNDCMHQNEALGERVFFSDVVKKYPEFEGFYKKNQKKKPTRKTDLIQHVMDKSVFINREENSWMKPVMEVVRKTSLFFQPQIRTKIMNEGWASYWHEKLFLDDDRIDGHEVDFARVHANVTSMPRVGLNPYALGMRLFSYIENLVDRGKYSIAYKRLLDADQRDRFDEKTGGGRDFITRIRETFPDFLFINNFVDQDFVTRHRLFVTGKRFNRNRMTWEYYVKSRNAEDYRNMLLDGLYHPPRIEVVSEKNKNGVLYLYHHFEGKPLVQEYIANTMLGIEYLWGRPVQLETTVAIASKSQDDSIAVYVPLSERGQADEEIKWQQVRYTMENRKLTKEIVQ